MQFIIEKRPSNKVTINGRSILGFLLISLLKLLGIGILIGVLMAALGMISYKLNAIYLVAAIPILGLLGYFVYMLYHISRFVKICVALDLLSFFGIILIIYSFLNTQLISVAFFIELGLGALILVLVKLQCNRMNISFGRMLWIARWWGNVPKVYAIQKPKQV